jgi:cytochrome c oxidase cbb3-type subunit 4
MDINQLSIYTYVIGAGVTVVVFYSYIVYLYRSEKHGKKDYEKYGKIALDDELDSTPIESDPIPENKKGEDK